MPLSLTDLDAITTEEVAAIEEPSPEVDKAIKHAEALSEGKADPDVVYDDSTPSKEEDTLLIHFTEDGFTALGVVWCKGQEVEFVIGSSAYEDTKDRFGKSWLDLVDNYSEQRRRFGRVMFSKGESPVTCTDANAVLEDRKRGRKPPRI